MAGRRRKTTAKKATKVATTVSHAPDVHEGTSQQHTVSLLRIEERQRLVSQYFANAKSFSRFVEGHSLSPLIKAKIAEEVALNRLELIRLAEASSIANLNQLSPLEKYRALVKSDCVDPSYIFAEFPAIAHSCELYNLSARYSKAELASGSEEVKVLQEEKARSSAYYNCRWRTLTREKLTTGPPFPPIARLTQLIAPVPFSSIWTEELFSREARSMGHAPAMGDPPQADSGPSAGASTSTSTSTGTDVDADADADSDTSSSSASSTRTGCEAEDIYLLAGAPPLKQPTSPPVSRDTRHTFPGNLRWGEDIFYDYAVMIPLDQCDLLEEREDLEARSKEAAAITAQYAKGIVQFLITQKLAGALGYGVANELHALLDQVIAVPEIDALQLPPQPALWELHVPPKATKSAIRALRKRLKERAALLRSISRMRILFQPATAQNYDQLIADLNSAIQPFEPGKLNQRDRWLPNSAQTEPEALERGASYPTLEVIDTSTSPEVTLLNNFYAHVRDHNFFVENTDDSHDEGSKPAGWFGVPNARAEWPEYSDPSGTLQTGTFEASYSTTRRHEALRRYIQYLGGPFYTKLTNLREQARAASASLDLIRRSPQSSDVLSEFGRFAEGVVNDALLALAQLLEDIAQQLPLAAATKGEGSKRLALMVIYRQFWFPEGYVAGKLVGYKNLLPNQKETLKRRTFIKTTREVSTTQEFAASREQDFTSSSKETAELVKESSSDFNFTAKTDGSFNFLIVSGDLETTTEYGRKDASKAMHNRVAEATMKSAVKYNEKREVKVRELKETEDLQELTTEVQNLNRDITANYFYYQLHRQYFVTTELAHIQPVLLRTREVPAAGTVDNKFLSDYAHILIHALPAQLSADLQETVGDIELLGRSLIRRRSELDSKEVRFEQFQATPPPATAEAQSAWRTQVDSMERAASDARSAFIQAEENHIRAQTRLDRVIKHVRENIHHYMQFIWHASPTVDQDQLLQEESFNGRPLGEITRGFIRRGYYGNEEVFEYAGASTECVNALSDDLIAGYQIVDSFTDEKLKEQPLFQRLKKYYPADTDEMIVERIRSHVFIRDPASPAEMNNSRHVQLAQDALVVEALPGQVPLLEGYQMAHRMLHVQKACLENQHLSERIKAKTWEQKSEDSYAVVRREGEGGSLHVSVKETEKENA